MRFSSLLIKNACRTNANNKFMKIFTSNLSLEALSALSIKLTLIRLKILTPKLIISNLQILHLKHVICLCCFKAVESVEKRSFTVKVCFLVKRKSFSCKGFHNSSIFELGLSSFKVIKLNFQPELLVRM